MARNLRLEIDGDAKSGRKALDDTADEAARAARQVDNLGDEARKASRKLSELNPAVVRTHRSLENTSTQARQTTASLGGLSHEVGRVEHAYDKAARAALKFNAAARLSPGGPGRGDGNSFFGLLASQLDEGLKKPFSASGGLLSGVAQNPYLLLAGLTAGALAAPAIGANIGGAIGFGGAAAVAGGGLAGAWMGDPDKYGGRWERIIDRLKSRWLSSTAQFGGPLERSLKEVDRIFRDLPIERLADAGKNFVDPLVQGAGTGLTAAADGFADLTEKSQPFVDKVAPELAGLGRDVGDALRNIGLGADGGAEALADLVNGIGYTIKATGVLIHGFERAYQAEKDMFQSIHAMATEIPILGRVTESVTDKVFGLESTTLTAAKALRSAGEAAEEAATGTAELSYAYDQLVAKQFAAKDASLALAQGWINLKKELADGKRTLDLNTQAGIDNQTAIVDQIENAERLRQQQIELTGNVEEANAAYDANIERIRKQAYALGFDKEQVDKLILSLQGLTVQPYVADVGVAGLAEAKREVGALGRLLQGISGTWTANVGISTGNLMHHAAGGSVERSGWSWVGERGPEIRWLNQGEYISSNTEAQRLASQVSRAGGGGSSSTISLTAAAPAGGSLEQAIISLFVGGVRGGRIKLKDGNGRRVEAA